jgi:hypothetical protein
MIKSVLRTLFILLLTLVCSCGGGRDKQVVDVEELHAQDSIDSAQDTLHLVPETSEPPKAVDELFDDFFYTFAVNPVFQLRRINFPLPCIDGDATKEITRDDWQQYNRFNSQDYFSFIYERDEDTALQKDTAINRVNVEWIYLQDDYVETYTFRRFKSKWILMSVTVSDIDALPNGEFLRFYAHFVSDSAFQAESISEPLKFVLTDEADEDDEGTESDTLLDISGWMAMRDELPIPHEALVSVDYGQPSQNRQHKTLLMAGMGDGLFMKFQFRREDGNWMLTAIEN